MVIAKFYYTNGSTMVRQFRDKGAMDWFAKMEGDHLLRYEELH